MPKPFLVLSIDYIFWQTETPKSAKLPCYRVPRADLRSLARAPLRARPSRVSTRSKPASTPSITPSAARTNAHSPSSPPNTTASTTGTGERLIVDQLVKSGWFLRRYRFIASNLIEWGMQQAYFKKEGGRSKRPPRHHRPPRNLLRTNPSPRKLASFPHPPPAPGPDFQTQPSHLPRYPPPDILFLSSPVLHFKHRRIHGSKGRY